MSKEADWNCDEDDCSDDDDFQIRTQRVELSKDVQNRLMVTKKLW